MRAGGVKDLDPTNYAAETRSGSLIGCTTVGIFLGHPSAAPLAGRELVYRRCLPTLLDLCYFGLALRLHHVIELRPSAGAVGIGNTHHTEQHQPGYRCYSLHVSHSPVRQGQEIPRASVGQV
jgi:hypothetical protein